MRVVMIGSGGLGIPALAGMLGDRNIRIAGVVSQPDRPRGRRRRVAPCPLKAVAQEFGLKCLAPERIAESAAIDSVRRLAPELLVVAAYGQFLPGALVSYPPHGAVNIHPSLLPRFRGAAPVQWTLAYGDRETGVTILKVARRMDAGDILMQQRVAIAEEETAAELEPRLAEMGADMLLEVITRIKRGTVNAVAQDESRVVWAPKLTKQDGRIEWSRPAAEVRNRIRGFQPWPVCFTYLPGEKRLRVFRAAECRGAGRPGEVLAPLAAGPVVACGRGALCLQEVQPAGAKRMGGAAFLRGHGLPPGSRLT